MLKPDPYAKPAEINHQAAACLSTDNEAALLAYSRGLDLAAQSGYSPSDVERAILMFETAVEEDADFAEAYAELAACHSYLYHNSDRGHQHQHRDQARRALEQARAHGPDLLAVRLAGAYFMANVELDVEQGIEELKMGLEIYPDSPEFLTNLGFIRRAQGSLDEAIRLLERAYLSSDDPWAGPLERTTAARIRANIADNIGETYFAMRDFEHADPWFQAALKQAPDFSRALGRRILNVLAWRGCDPESGCTTEEARALLESSRFRNEPGLYPLNVILDLYDSTLSKEPETFFRRIADRIDSTPQRPGGLGEGSFYFWYEALAYQGLGDSAAASNLVRESFNELSSLSPTPSNLARLGIAHAWLGQGAEALEAGRRAVDLEENHFLGPVRREHLAVILVLLGHHDTAMEQLRSLVKTHYRGALNDVQLRLDPIWADLRQRQDFTALLAGF